MHLIMAAEGFYHRSNSSLYQSWHVFLFLLQFIQLN